MCEQSESPVQLRTVGLNGVFGLRWWSAFFGEWHTVVLFLDAITVTHGHGEPELLSLDHPAVVDAAGALVAA